MTKTLDQLMFAFYAKNDGLRITDLHQGIVWGTQTAQTSRDERLINRFDYDGDYGTVLNRFLMQAAIGHPLTVHGTGGQTRAFIHIRDTVRCIELAHHQPARGGRPAAGAQPDHRDAPGARPGQDGRRRDGRGDRLPAQPAARGGGERPGACATTSSWRSASSRPRCPRACSDEGTEIAKQLRRTGPTPPRSSPARSGRPAWRPPTT